MDYKNMVREREQELKIKESTIAALEAALKGKDREHENQLIQLEKVANEVMDGYTDKVATLKAEKEQLQKAYFGRGQEILDLEMAARKKGEKIATLTTELKQLHAFWGG